MKEYFSKTYEEARQKFKEATKNFKKESIQLRDDLYIDFACKEKKEKKTILILVSGTHGAEAYLGSAAQLLLIKEFLPKLKKTSVCLIHSLNPYGFKHNRRVNENNVDLNRNAIYDERLKLGIPNTFFTNIWSDSLLFLKLNRPRKHRIIETINYYALVFKTITKQGLKNTINLGVEGQTKYPKGVGYKGAKLEDSLLHFRTFIEEKTKGYEQAILIDIHSGIGTKYEVQGITNQDPQTEEYKLLKKTLKKLKSRKKRKTTNHTGSISDLFLARTHATKNIDLTLEYGTIPQLTSNLVFDSLAKLNIEENQIFYYGNEKQRQKIQKKYKKAYSPMDAVFKKSLIRKTRKFYEKLIQEIE